jgi:3-oxoacyl-[acyl-carrier protein] reductase
MSAGPEGKACVIVTSTGGSTGDALALALAREGALVVDHDVSVDTRAALVERVRGVGGDTVSEQPWDFSDAGRRKPQVELSLGGFREVDPLSSQVL